MSIEQQSLADLPNQELLYFWALGDLHFREHEQWKALHTPRMEQMFADLHALWHEEGQPAFCVSPGDLVDRGAPRNYQLARKELKRYLNDMPFYPGLGNHEYYPENDENAFHSAEEYCAAWDRPVRYAWTGGKDESIVCLMLDHFFADILGEPKTLCTPETLHFLETTLTEHAGRRAVIFAHCPLHNTVLDRDPVRHLDDDSLAPFFFVENSPEVRAILARHSNVALYLSGHT
ncbi:MAG TPA: metallophosphoesterase, partial [Ktedonobacteraceae bacterium]